MKCIICGKEANWKITKMDESLKPSYYFCTEHGRKIFDKEYECCLCASKEELWTCKECERTFCGRHGNHSEEGKNIVCVECEVDYMEVTP